MKRTRLGSTWYLLAGALIAAVAAQAMAQAPPATPPAPVTAPSSTQTATQQPQPVVSVRIDQAGPLRLLTESADRGGTPWPVILPPLISGVITLVGAFLALYYGYRNTRRSIESAARNSESSVWQKANEVEFQDIERQIAGFYARFQQLSQISTLFARDLRNRQMNPQTFFLLEKLFDQSWVSELPNHDKTVIREILRIVEELEALINNRTSPINEKLVPYFARASAHFRVIRLAYNGELGSDPSLFRVYIYPRQLNNVLVLEIRRLRDRQATLRAFPSAPPGPMPELIIPEDDEHTLRPWVAPPTVPLAL